jgi:hypothetical protein
MTYTEHAPWDNGSRDLFNGHVDFEWWWGWVEDPKKTTALYLVRGLKRSKKGNMKIIMSYGVPITSKNVVNLAE